MANPFDRFDQAPGNPFDAFDEPADFGNVEGGYAATGIAPRSFFGKVMYSLTGGAGRGVAETAGRHGDDLTTSVRAAVPALKQTGYTAIRDTAADLAPAGRMILDPIGSMFGGALDGRNRLLEAETGTREFIQERADAAGAERAQIREGLSPQAQAQDQEIGRAYREGGFFSGLLANLRNPSSIGRLVAESAPATGVAMLGGRLGGARGVMAATVPMGAGEAMSGLRDEIMQANPFDLMDAPEYQQALASGLSDAEAREALFESVRDTAGMVGAGAGTIPGIAGLNPVEQALTRPAATTAARGALGRMLQSRGGRAAAEAIGEVPEEVGITLGSNIAQDAAGLDVSLYDDVAQAAGGAVLAGGVMGAMTPGQAQPLQDGADLLNGGTLADAMRRQREPAADPAGAAGPALPAGPGATGPAAPEQPTVDELLTRNVPALPAAAEPTPDAALPPVEAAAAAAATSPANALPEPTQAQKEAGNYAKGHVRLNGLDISIENPAGSQRSGTAPDGRAWSNTMQAHYGYIRGTTGKDGDHIDAFIRPGYDGQGDGPVFVIDQFNESGEFDEHKVMLGYQSEAEARAAYRANYDAEWTGLGGVRSMSLDDFKAWSKRPRLTKQPTSIEGKARTSWRSDLAAAEVDEGLRSTLGRRFERAAAVAPRFARDLEAIASEVGGRPILAPLKSVGRTVKKVQGDYKGDPTRVTDLVRGTVEVQQVEDGAASVEMLTARYGKPIKFKDRMSDGAEALESGYRDMNGVWEVNGEPVEIQVNVPEMLAAKEKAHKLYEEWQEITRAAAREKRVFTPAEQSRVDELNRLQREIYEPAWEAATRRMNSARGSRSASSRNTEQEMISPVGQIQQPPGPSSASAPSGMTPNDARSSAAGSARVVAGASSAMGSTSGGIVPSAGSTEWAAFPADSGTLGIPRAEMPQVKGKDRQAYLDYLAGMGITGETTEVDAAALKPTQAEYSTVKTDQFVRTGPIGERAVLISSDGYVLDGHHQWMASKQLGIPVRVIELNAPIQALLDATNAFPGVQRSSGAGGMSTLDLGSDGVAYTASNEPIRFKYALVDDGALVASNETDGRVNPSYPIDLQPRDRTSAESRASVAAIAGNLAPERLGASGDIVNGAPLVGPDGVVESGNGRVMALRATSPARRDAYKAWLVENAEQFGLDPAKVKKAQAPVLVRVRAGELSMAERARIGQEGNRGTQQAMNPIEVARADARVIDDDLMALFEPGEDGNVLAASNQPFLLAFARELGGMEAAGLSAGGRWTKQMADRVNAAVFYRAYGDDRLLAAFAAEADPDMKNILAALGRAAKEFAIARSAGAADAGLDAGALLAGAVQILADARGRGQSLQEYLAQGSLLGDGPAGPEAAMATWLASNARAHRRISDTLIELGRDIRAELESRQSGDMFGRSDRSLPEMVDGRVEQQRAGVREPGTQPYRADERGDLPGERDGPAGADADGVPGFELTGQPGPAARRVASGPTQGGLFPPASTAEWVEAERRRREDQLNARGQRAVPMIEGDGELFAGPRPDQADIEAPVETAQLSEQDRATYGKTRPLPRARAAGEAANEAVADPGQGAAARLPGQLDLFVVTRGPAADPQPATFPNERKLRTHAAVVTTGELRTGIRQVRSWQDAAHVIAPIRKSPQEHMVALVVGANGEPLAVIRHAIGVVDGASVEPWSLAGSVAAVPGARQVYFAHNHPSGLTEPSHPDRIITGRLVNLLEGSGIEPMGMIVVGGGSSTAHFITAEGYVNGREPVTPAARRDTVPVQERVLRRARPGGGSLGNPAEMIDFLKRSAIPRSGVLLLDTRHRPIGIIPMTVEEMAFLRTGDPATGAASVLRQVAAANGTAAVVFIEPGQANIEAAQNLGALLNDASVRTLDIIEMGQKQPASLAQKGRLVSGTKFFSRRPRFWSTAAGQVDGVPAARIREMVDAIRAKWRGDAPKVEVLESAEGLPEWVKSDPGYREAEGFYDADTGTVYLVAPNLGSFRRARDVLMHEVIGHYGIEAIAGPETWAWVRGHVERMRRDGRHKALFEDLDSRYSKDDPAYLREVVAVMAERGVGTALIDRLAAAVRRFLAGMGFVAPASEDAIRQLIVRAARQLATGTDPAADVAPELLFSRPAGQRQHSKAQLGFLTKAGLRPDTRTWLQRLRDGAREHATMLRDAYRDGDARRQAVVDRFHGIRAAYESAGETDMTRMEGYVSARLSTGLPAVMESVMMHGAPEWRDGILSVKAGTRGLLQALAPVRDSIDDWLGWMVARRAKVLKDQGRENLMSDADIAAGLSLATGRETEFNRAALDYLTLKNAVLDVAEQAGLIDPLKRAVWDHAEYIPFYRDDVDSIGPGTRKGLAGQSSGIRTLRGGDTALADPLGNIVRNFTRLIDASLKNNAMLEIQGDLPGFFEKMPAVEFKQATVPLEQVRKHLLDTGMDRAAVDALPQAALQGFANFWAVEPPVADDVVRIFRHGKPEYHKVADPLLLRSLTAFKPRMPSWFMQPLIWAKRVLTAGATGTAEFVGANFMRDALEGWMVADDRFRPVVDSMRGALSALKSDEKTQELMMSGAYFAHGHIYGHDPDATAAALRRSLRAHGVKNKDLESFAGSIARGPAWLWDRWTHLQSGIEHGTRRALQDAALAAGKDRKQAAFAAKDLLDFSMRGDSEFVAFFTDVVPFLNARLQGLYKLGRSAHRNRQQMALRGGTLAATSLALLAWNLIAHQEGYDELEEWDRDMYWHIGPGTAYHIRVPKPFELGLVFGTAPERGARALLNAAGSEAGDSARQTWMAVLHALGETLAVNPIPQALSPIVEQIANRNFFSGRPIENLGDQRLLPEARAEWYTSNTMQLAPAWFNNATGLSPKRLEHLWRGYTAGLGGYALAMSDWLVRRAQDEPWRPGMHLRDVPLVGRFARGDAPPRSTSYQTEFYRLKQRAENIEGTVKEYLVRAAAEGREDLRTRALELHQENFDLLGPSQYRRGAKAGVAFGVPTHLRRVQDHLAGLRNQEQAIALDRAMTAAEKRDRIDELVRQRNEILRQTVLLLRGQSPQNPSSDPN